jgi:hypothetical protein
MRRNGTARDAGRGNSVETGLVRAQLSIEERQRKERALQWHGNGRSFRPLLIPAVQGIAGLGQEGEPLERLFRAAQSGIRQHERGSANFAVVFTA